MISQSTYLFICISACIYKLDVEPFEHPFKVNARQRLTRSANGCVLIKYIFHRRAATVCSSTSRPHFHICACQTYGWMGYICVQTCACVRVFVCVRACTHCVDAILTLMRSNSVRAVHNFFFFRVWKWKHAECVILSIRRRCDWAFLSGAIRLLRIATQIYASRLAKSLSEGLIMPKLTKLEYTTTLSFFFLRSLTTFEGNLFEPNKFELNRFKWYISHISQVSNLPWSIFFQRISKEFKIRI